MAYKLKKKLLTGSLRNRKSPPPPPSSGGKKKTKATSAISTKSNRRPTQTAAKPKTQKKQKTSSAVFVKRAPKAKPSFDLPTPVVKTETPSVPPVQMPVVSPKVEAIISAIGATKPSIRKKISRRKPGQKSISNYFDEKTQQSIVDYQNEPDVEIKKKIYIVGILPAFDALVENLINVYGFQVIHDSKQDLKNECLEFLYRAVTKFNPNKGSKAFSYFNVVAKHWLTIKSKQNAKKVQTYISIDNKEDISKEDLELIESHQIMPSYDEVVTQAEVHAQLGKMIDSLEKLVKTQNELSCIAAIKTLIANLDNIDLLSKRAVLLYIREMTGLSPKQLSLCLSSIKKHYKVLKNTEEFSA